MTVRRLTIVLLLLAACSDAQPARESTATRDAVAAPAAEGTANEREADLPDFGDRRLFLSLDFPGWTTMETRSPADRLARLHALGIQPVRSDSTGPREAYDTMEMAGYDPNGEQARAYHFVDFSGDGVDDVIYSGAWYIRNENGEFAAAEGTHLKLYQVMNGRAVLVMDHHGDFQRLFRGRPGEPASFRAIHHGCCADPEWSFDYYRPVRAGDTVRYEPYHRVMGREGVQLPATFLARPRAFTVANDGYLLRESPSIEPDPAAEEDWYRWEGHGNALAEYGRGARGIALAERTDGTGRVWWFVRMDGRTPPRDAQFDEQNGEGIRLDRLGWMSSRFLTAEP
ncbi:hypothetical protein [Longimicrobium sp.]|uniref:hypothetical protein n=1 Tax=Longimicrobium sp. TaxID=2029185 RepID=UPI002E34FB5E|nr:hypothetical protein [Longimicrobium sp.]HEX6037078.1 hypothetical protein [Longimicrobium sp.]